jgi:hypothetical protein
MIKINHHFIFFLYSNKIYFLCTNYNGDTSILNLIYSPKFVYFSNSIYPGSKGLTSDEDFGRIFTSMHFEKFKNEFESGIATVIEHLFLEKSETPTFKINTVERSITLNFNNYYYTLITNLIAYPIVRRIEISPFVLNIDLEIDSQNSKVPIEMNFGSFNSFEDALLYLKNNYHNL